MCSTLRVTRSLPLLALIAAAACADPAPTAPAWADVAPILASNCVRCHGAPAIGGAPTTFVLDRYDDLETPAGRVLGAASMAEWIAARVADGSMPPRFPLVDHDVDVLVNWYATRPPTTAGGPLLGPPRGPARKDNQLPQLTVEALAQPAAIELRYQLRDPDRDLVVGELEAMRLGTDPIPVGALHSGRGTLLLDTALLPSGRYQLFATLDDGAGPRRSSAGELELTAPTPAPPRLALRAPAQGEIVAAAELPFEVELTARDVDTAQLMVTVSLIDDRAPQLPLDTRTLTLAAGATERVALGAADTPAALTYRVVATVSDGAAVHQQSSGRFRVSRETSDDTFKTISDDVLSPHCLRCHSGSPRVPNLAIDLSRYRGTVAAPGVYDLRSRIFLRAVVAQTMPPGSARIERGDLPPEARERLARWLLAGAPE